MRNKLYSLYELKKDRIKKRLLDFNRFFNEPVVWNFDGKDLTLVGSDKTDDERLFEELSFCLLTANTSAAMSAKSIDFLRENLENATLEQLQHSLKRSGYRFPNVRAKYIIEAREKKLKLRELVLSNEKHKLREYLAENIKGLGYKESSHFLRNIGITGLAILDKHIIRSMYEYGEIKEIPKTLNKKTYMRLEKKFLQFSEDLDIDEDELDLLLWSIKSGNILK